MDLTGEFSVTRDGKLFHQQTMNFPNLSNEQAGQLKEYTDACEKDLKQAARKPGPGTFAVKLHATIDGVGASDLTGEGLSYKDLVQFQRKMHNHQDKLLKYAEEQVARPTPKA